MAEYIPREEVLKHSRNLIEYDEGGWDNDIQAVPADDIQNIPAADVIEISKVAKILCDAFGNECPCNFNCIDEWLPLICKCVNDYNCDCDSVYGWEEFLRHYDERNDVEEYNR